MDGELIVLHHREDSFILDSRTVGCGINEQHHCAARETLMSKD